MPKPLVLAFATSVAFACTADYTIWSPRTTDADPLYRFVKNGKAGYIDHTGKVVIPPTLEVHGNYGSEFHDGLLEIGVSDGRYVDRTGEVVLDKGLDRGWDFSEGLAVAMRKTKSSGVIYAGDFSEGFAVVGNSPGSAFDIDRDGNRAFSGNFQRASPFFKGLAHVCLQGCDDPDNTRARYAYIDTTGRRVFTYEASSLF